jgi:hypothetical protein
MLMISGAAAQGSSEFCYIDVTRQGQACVCEAGGAPVRQSDMAACRRGEERLSALAINPSSPPGVTPENPPTENPPPHNPPGHNPPGLSKPKGNNGIGNTEMGDPPGIGNSGNDVEGTKTARSDGPGARGKSGSRPGSEAVN